MNIIDYMYWRGDLSYEQDSFNDIDALIFSIITYIEYDEDTPLYPSKKQKKYVDTVDDLFLKTPMKEINMGLLLPNEIVSLGDLCAKSNRFGKIKVSNYINKISIEEQEQFSALTFHFAKNKIFISMRGTDDTFIGWQENINMICEYTIPAQYDAATYVNKIAKMFPDDEIYIGGHSKGGNLATYAAIYCDDSVKDRIMKVYSFDGPGFHKKKIDKVKYKLIKNKLYSFLPQGSIVGMFFDLISTKNTIVKSTMRGVNQHNAFSWQIQGNQFILSESLTQKSIEIDNNITSLLNSLTVESRKELAEDVFNFFSKLDIQNLIDIKENKRKLIASTKYLAPKHRKFLISVILIFVKYGAL